MNLMQAIDKLYFLFYSKLYRTAEKFAMRIGKHAIAHRAAAGLNKRISAMDLDTRLYIAVYQKDGAPQLSPVYIDDDPNESRKKLEENQGVRVTHWMSIERFRLVSMEAVKGDKAVHL